MVGSDILTMPFGLFRMFVMKGVLRLLSAKLLVIRTGLLSVMQRVTLLLLVLFTAMTASMILLVCVFACVLIR